MEGGLPWGVRILCSFEPKIGLKTPKEEMLGANELAACKAVRGGVVSQ